MFGDDRIQIDLRPVFFDRQPQMLHSGSGDATFPPTMDGGDRQLQESGYRRGPVERVYDEISFGLHGDVYAIIADHPQVKICDNRDCVYRGRVEGAAMDPEEIKAELDRRGMSQRDLAQAIGMDENYLSKSLARKRQFKLHEMDAIRNELAPEPGDAEKLVVRTIPLLGDVPAGSFEPQTQRNGPRMVVADPDIPPRAYGLRIKGDSMDLIAPDGSTVIIDPDDRSLWPGRRYVVRSADGGTTFKEYQDGPARLVPCSSNPAHREILLGDEPISIEGSVFSYHLRDAPRRGV